MGTLGYWKNVSGFFLIGRPFCTLMRKKQTWEWPDSHKQTLRTLIQELKTHQALGPVHSSDPIIVKWGFSEYGTYCNMFQKSPHVPKQPLRLSSTGLKNTNMRYIDWEKGLLSLT